MLQDWLKMKLIIIQIIQFLQVTPKYSPWLPPGLTRIQSWYDSKFQLNLAIYGPLVPKLCSDKSESGGKWILVSHWLRILQILGISQWETRIHFPPLFDLSEHSFGISGLNITRISWKGGNRGYYTIHNQSVQSEQRSPSRKCKYNLFNAKVATKSPHPLNNSSYNNLSIFMNDQVHCMSCCHLYKYLSFEIL